MKFSNSLLSSVIVTLSAVNAAVLPVSGSSAGCTSTTTVTAYATTNIPFPESIEETTSSSSTSTTTTSSSSSSSAEVTTSAITTSSDETTSSSSTELTASPTTSSTKTTKTAIPNKPTTKGKTATTPTVTRKTTTSSTSSSTSSTAAPTSTGFSFKDEYLAKHNFYRNLMIDTPPLVWNDEIADITQKLADNYSCNGVLTHSDSQYQGDGLGENLAYGYDFESAGAVTAWFNEISLFNYNDPVFAPSTGHFTQLVWKGTTDVGCGYKNCGNEYGYYIICDYSPSGNWDNPDDLTYWYRLNVMEPKDPATKNGFPF